MKKKYFYGVLILAFLGSNLLTAVVCNRLSRLLHLGGIFMTRLKAAELNEQLLQIVLSRLERQDPELPTKLRRIQEEYHFSYEGSNLPELLKKHFPEEFPPHTAPPPDCEGVR